MSLIKYGIALLTKTLGKTEVFDVDRNSCLSIGWNGSRLEICGNNESLYFDISKNCFYGKAEVIISLDKCNSISELLNENEEAILNVLIDNCLLKCRSELLNKDSKTIKIEIFGVNSDDESDSGYLPFSNKIEENIEEMCNLTVIKAYLRSKQIIDSETCFKTVVQSLSEYYSKSPTEVFDFIISGINVSKKLISSFKTTIENINSLEFIDCQTELGVMDDVRTCFRGAKVSTNKCKNYR